MAIIQKQTPKGTILIIKGRALWPKLIEPDTKFKAEGEYTTKLILSDDDATELRDILENAQAAAVAAAIEEAAAKGKRLRAEKIKQADIPLKELEDRETGEPTGEWAVNVKCKASGTNKAGKAWQRKVPLFDAKGTPIPEDAKPEIWNGSILKVNCTINPFYTDMAGAGNSLRLTAVQIIELSSSVKDAGAYGFDAEDGYTSEPGADPFGPASGTDESGTPETDF